MGSRQVLALVHKMFQNSHAEIVKALFMDVSFTLTLCLVRTDWKQ